MVAYNDKQKQMILAKMARLGIELYNCMDDGQSLELILPTDQQVVIPGQPGIKRSLFVFKPSGHINIDIKSKPLPQI